MEGASGPRAELAKLIEEHREDFAGLSRMLGRNAAYIQQFIKRGVPRRLSEGDRDKLARYFGIDPSLLGGPKMATAADELVAIPSYQVYAAAGPGAFSDEPSPSAEIWFSKSLLRRIGGNRSQNELSIIRVRGDSMAPTLNDGDDILVDRSDRTPLHDGVYVLRRDDALSVKRIAVHPGSRTLTVASDNAAYPTWHDCNPSDVDVIGRVIWAGRRIN